MNNKGFTLIELVATIGLLAVVAIISYVSINKVIEESKVNDCEQLVMSIKSAAKEYVSDNRYTNKLVIYELSADERYTLINVDSLIQGKYLSSPIINPFDNSNLTPGDFSITVRLNSDNTISFKEDKEESSEDDTIIIKYVSGRIINCKNKEW